MESIGFIYGIMGFSFGLMGFIFGISAGNRATSALDKVSDLERRLREAGVLEGPPIEEDVS